MSAPNTAIKFATANKTPSQASQGPEEKSQGKTPQRGSKSKSRVGGGIMVASVVPTSMVASSTSSKIPCTRTSTTIELDDASNLDADDFVSLLNDNDMDDRLSLVSTSASKKLKASASCVPPNQAKVRCAVMGESYFTMVLTHTCNHTFVGAGNNAARAGPVISTENAAIIAAGFTVANTAIKTDD